MKLLVTPTSFLKPANEQAKVKLEAFADAIVYNDLGKPLQGDELLSRLDGADGYIAGLDYITADVVKQMPDSVKVISRYGAGVDRVDIAACKERGIIVTNTPGANATAVCEMAFGLMLCAARNIPMLHKAVEAGEWPRANGMELSGKSLGIVGLGAIGKRLALRAKAFEMDVIAFDPYFDEAFGKEHGITRVELDDLFKTADVVSLHVPLSDATRHMVNADRIREMKQGGILINTARGGLIDEEAAAEAVKSGHLRGLGLDAFEQEPLVDSPLKGLPGVVFTPHAAGHTAQAISRMGMMAVDNAIQVLSGQKCPYQL
jgi:D-3-phosphoglycerate dehydrogenase